MGIQMGPGPNLLLNKLIEDYKQGILDEQGMKDVLITITYKQLKSLYVYVMSVIDPIYPDEKLMDLLDLIDPNETYFQ
jgi:hypothetical protein